MRSMATDMRAMGQRPQGRMTPDAVRYNPGPIHRPMWTPGAQQRPVDTAALERHITAARSHNTFRPDIYRVSEGFLN